MLLSPSAPKFRWPRRAPRIFLKRLSLARWHEDGDGLASVAAIDPEILIEGDYGGAGVEFGHPHEAGVGERHGNVGVFRHELRDRLDFRRQLELWQDDATADERQQSVGT
jgi:hypothetical protein